MDATSRDWIKNLILWVVLWLAACCFALSPHPEGSVAAGLLQGWLTSVWEGPWATWGQDEGLLSFYLSLFLCLRPGSFFKSYKFSLVSLSPGLISTISPDIIIGLEESWAIHPLTKRVECSWSHILAPAGLVFQWQEMAWRKHSVPCSLDQGSQLVLPKATHKRQASLLPSPVVSIHGYPCRKVLQNLVIESNKQLLSEFLICWESGSSLVGASDFRSHKVKMSSWGCSLLKA